MQQKRFSIYEQEKQTSFLESSDGDIKKLVTNAVNVFGGEEIYEQTSEI